MSIYYNDYEQTVMTYLRKYTDWKVYLENLQEKISDLESNLALEPAPKTSQFRDTPPPSGFDSGWPRQRVEPIFLSIPWRYSETWGRH